jgi:hypothetical protein
MLKLEVLTHCKICNNCGNTPVRRYIDEVGRTVIAHTRCVKVHNKIEKHQKHLTNAEWEMYNLKR